MTFGEELALLLLDERTGTFWPVHDALLDRAFAGSALMDLARSDRVDTDLDRLVVLDAKPLRDDILDPVLKEVAEYESPEGAAFWVTRIAEASGKDLRAKFIERLVTSGILEADEGGFWSFVPSIRHARRYPSVDVGKREEIHLRVMRILFDEDIPDPDDVAIVSLADSCGLFRHILTLEELQSVRDRIELVTRMDLIGRSIIQTIKAASDLRSAWIARATREIPTAPKPDTLTLLRGGYIDYLKEQYAKYGPIFQTSARGQSAVIMVGAKANQFFNKYDQTHFRSTEFWSQNDRNFGANRSVFSMFGEDHFRMRRIKSPGYSRKMGEDQVPELIRVVREEIASWPINKPIRGTKLFKRIIYNLSANLLMGMSVPEYFEDLDEFLESSLMVTLERYPVKRMQQKRLRRIDARLDELASKIIEAHDPEQRERSGRPPDLVDAMLALNRSEPQFMPETDLKLAVLEPLWIPVDTTGHVSGFMMYFLLKHADIREQLTAEADALFAESETAPSFQSILGLDVTRRTFLETARIYPPLMGISRTASNTFEFEGCKVPAGSKVLVAMGIPHTMEEYFPDPGRFDIDRFKAPRNEHSQPGVYMPFGVGTHRCLGGHLAEFLIAATFATILHDVEVELCPPSYTVTDKQISYVPTIHLKKSFRFRVLRRRR